MDGKIWYYVEGNTRQGPLPGADLRGMIEAGRLSRDTLIWTDGMADWQPAAQHLPRAESFPNAPPAPPPPFGQAQSQGYGQGQYGQGQFAQSQYGQSQGQPYAPQPAPMHSAASGQRDYHEKVTIQEALARAFKNYATFSGRANRGEFWWFVLAQILISLGLSVVELMLTGTDVLASLWSLAVFLPSLAITARRLHDIDRSAWWLLLILLPLIGALVLIFFCVQRGENRPNRFG